MSTKPSKDRFQRFSEVGLWISIKSLWDLLTSPSEKIEKIGMQRRARMLSAMLICINLALLVSLITSPVNEETPILGTALVLMLVGYGLSRTSYYLFSAIFTVWVSILPTFLNAFTTVNYAELTTLPSFAWLVVPLFLAKMLLPLRQILWITGSILVGVAVLPILVHTIPMDFYLEILVYLSLLSGLLIVAASIQAKEAADRKKAEAQWSTLVENMPDLIIQADREGIILSLNRTVPGYNMADVLNTSIYKYVTPDYIPIVRSAVERVFETGETSTYEVQGAGPLGQTAWYTTRVTPLQHQDTVTSVMLITTDITQRKQVEKDVQKSEERYRKLMHAANDAIFLMKNDIFIECNPRTLEMFGCSEDQIIGCQPYIFSPPTQPDGRSSTDKALDKINAALAGRFQFFEWKHCRWDGSEFDAEVSLSRLVFGNELYLLAIVRDITDRKHAEASLIEAKEKAEALNRLKNNFLANISHEIRTPLNGIIGFTSILVEELKHLEHRSYAQRILKGSQRLLNTINDLLDLSKLEAGKRDFERIELDLVQACRANVSLLEPLALQKEIRLEVRAYQPSIYAKLDLKAFDQIMLNLLGNALKFTAKGQVRVELDQIATESGAKAIVRVMDTGIGISPEFLPYIFDEFKQESSGYGRHYEGTGLGLKISKKLLELMDGTINVESAKGHGTTFILRFPAIEPQRSEIVAPQEEVSPTITPSHLTGAKPGPPQGLPKVLMVEDDSDSQEIARRYLNGICQIDMVSSGTEAIEHASQQRYDAILMDINLGHGPDGIAITAQLRQIRDYAQIPIIALTAYTMKGDRERFLDAQFDDHIAKPYQRHDFQEFMRKVLSE